MSAPKGDVSGALASLGPRFGRALTGTEVEALGQYVRLLLDWNARINLTGARSAADVIEEHLPDAFALAALVPPGAKLVDIGSGGGLPGIPFGVLRPDVRLTLVEPRSRRVAFLRTAVRALELSAEVKEARAEALPAGLFEVACSRATFPPPEWFEAGARLTGPGGQVVLFVATEAGETLEGIPEPSSRVDYEVRGRRGRAALSVTVPRGTAL